MAANTTPVAARCPRIGVAVFALVLTACSASQGQARILFDDFVTDEEYESAFFAMYDCVEATGAKISQPIRDPKGQLGFAFPVQGALEDSPTEAAYNRCEEQHFQEVAIAWSIQQEEVRGETMLECMFGAELQTMTNEEIERGLPAKIEDKPECL